MWESESVNLFVVVDNGLSLAKRWPGSSQDCCTQFIWYVMKFSMCSWSKSTYQGPVFLAKEEISWNQSTDTEYIYWTLSSLLDSCPEYLYFRAQAKKHTSWDLSPLYFSFFSFQKSRHPICALCLGQCSILSDRTGSCCYQCSLSMSSMLLTVM